LKFRLFEEFLSFQRLRKKNKCSCACGEYVLYSPHAVRRMMRYIHQLNVWPKFVWDQEKIVTLLGAVRNRQGRLMGRMEAIGTIWEHNTYTHKRHKL